MNPEFLTAAFSAAMELSWRGGWLIVALLVLRRLVGTRVPARFWHLAWLAVAIRLFLPVNIAVSWPTFGWTRALETPPQLSAPASTPTLTAVHAPTAAATLLELPEPRRAELTLHAPTSQTAAELTFTPPAPTLPSRTRAEGPATGSLWPWAALTWALGIVALVALRVFAGWRLRAQLRQAVAIDDPRLRRILALHAGRAEIACLETDAVTAPALHGLLCVRLLFPRGMIARLDDDELTLVLRHELGHWQRRDLWAQALVHAAVIAHWFNPLAWWLARQARADCELACDEFVLRRETDGGQAYGAVLLKVLGMVKARRDTPLSAVGIVGGRGQLVQRIRQVAAFRPASAWRVGVALVALGALLTASATREVRAQSDSTAAAASAGEPALRVITSTSEGNTGAAAAPVAVPSISVSSVTVPDSPPVVLVAPTPAIAPGISMSVGVAAPVAMPAPAPQPVALSEWVSADVRVRQIREYRERGQDLSNLSFIAEDSLVRDLTKKLTEQRLRLKELEQRYAERHPQIIGINHVIQETEKERIRAMLAACARIEAEQEALQRQRQRDEARGAAVVASEVSLLSRALAEKEELLRAQQRELSQLHQRLAADAGNAAGRALISVLGAVNIQGVVTFLRSERPTVTKAVAYAGGLARTADIKAVRLTRQEADGTQSSRTLALNDLLAGLSPDIELQDRDLLFVPERSEAPVRTVSITGQVVTPGRQALSERGMTVVDAIAAAGGPARLADLRRVKVTRQLPKGTNEVRIYNLTGVFGSTGSSTPEPTPELHELQPGDVVFVPERVI